MIERKFSPTEISEARRRAVAMGNINNSITHGEGNIYGFLGEMMVADFLGVKILDTYDYDLIKGSDRIDVKTKCCSSQPLLTYECSIAALGKKQQCDYYVFTRVLKNCLVGWILGAISKQEYFRKARFCKGGSVDPLSDLGWVFKADCYNLAINELRPIDEIWGRQRPKKR